MKIQFWAIGKNHDSYIKEGVEEFTKRISNYYPVSWNIISGLKNKGILSESDLKKKEADIVLALLKKEDYLIVLDEKGVSVNTPGLSKFIDLRATESHKQLIFFIGGAYGSDQRILDRANFIWSLSQLTFPHQLVRLILCEQFYRVCTISRNENYHHS